MSIIKQLLEMDPFMGPYGGILGPSSKIAVPGDEVDYVAPDRRERLLKSLTCRNPSEEEEEIGPEEPSEEMVEQDEDDTCSSVIEFIKNVESPTEEDFEQAAEQCGMPVEELKLTVFDLARALLMGVGKHSDIPDEEFDPEELQKGIEVEMEHTNNLMIAKVIAKDHLMEIPDYYNRLDDLEKEGQSDQAQVGDGKIDDQEDDEGDDHDYGDGDTFGGEDDSQDDEEYK